MSTFAALRTTTASRRPSRASLPLVLAALVIAGAVALVAPDHAHAQSSDDAFKLRVEGLTEVPLHAGVAATAEGPHRLRLRLATGILPKPYVALSNSVVQAFSSSYDDNEAQLVEAAITNAVVVRFHAGWRPMSDLGLVVYTGITWVGLGGDATGAELLEGLTGVELEDNEAQGTLSVDATSTLWMADIAVGWEWEVVSDLTLYTGLGWSYTFQAEADLSISPTPTTRSGQRAATALEQAGATYLVDLYRTYIHPPTLTVSAAWSLL